jgi:hypothetical protein
MSETYKTSRPAHGARKVQLSVYLLVAIPAIVIALVVITVVLAASASSGPYA